MDTDLIEWKSLRQLNLSVGDWIEHEMGSRDKIASINDTTVYFENSIVGWSLDTGPYWRKLE